MNENAPPIDGFGGNLDAAFDAPAPAVPTDAVRSSANALLHQIDIGDFVDSHGHSAKMLKAVHDLMRALSAAPAVRDAEISVLRENWMGAAETCSRLHKRIEADAREIARLKTVPMKYRRMAFNAQLQEENKALYSRVSTLERRLREVTNQRDKAKGRTRELQAYVTKYQRELAQLKKEKRNERHQPD